MLQLICVFQAKYLGDEAKEKSGKDIDVSSWDMEFVEDLPQQQNGYVTILELVMLMIICIGTSYGINKHSCSLGKLLIFIYHYLEVVVSKSQAYSKTSPFWEFNPQTSEWLELVKRPMCLMLFSFLL